MNRTNAVAVLALAYAIGLTGWLLDWRAHLAGAAATPYHVMMEAGFVVALVCIGWLARRVGRRTAAIAGSGAAILVAGMVVDGLWHAEHPHVVEIDPLTLLGHQIYLAGWIIGVAAAGYLLKGTASTAASK